MKRLLALFLSILTMTLTLVPAAAFAAEESPRTPSILLDGLPLAFEVPPQIIEGRTMVPFRAIAEALGAHVIWSEANRSIQAYGPDALVYLRVGEKTMWVNGVPTELDVPPMIVENRTLIPLRAFATGFGAQVGWDGERFTVTITSAVRKMKMLGFYALGSFPNRHLVPRFTDVAYGWSRLHADGTLNLTGPEYFWPQPAGEITPAVLLKDAASAGTRRYLMVHEVDSDLRITNLILDEALTAKAVESIATLVEERGFDGVLLDLEYLGWSERNDELAQVKQGYVNLVTAVAERLRPAGKQTAVSLHPLNGSYHGYDYAALAQVADTIEIMAHDYNDVDGLPEPNDRVDEAIRTAVAAVGEQYRAKLLLGILSTETPETLTEKVGLAKRYNIGGVALWTLGALSEAQVQALDSTVIRKP